MAFLTTIEEQASFKFTGRINVLSVENNQFYGYVLMREGYLVQAKFRGEKLEHALYSIVFADIENQLNLKFVVEPEIVSDDEAIFKMSFIDLKKNAETSYAKFKDSIKLRPPADLHLLIRPEFIIEGANLELIEFKTLETITEYSKVEDIYKNSDLLDHEITEALVSLRKKKALKVCR